MSRVVNSILAFNRGGGVRLPGDAVFRHNCVWGNTPYNFAGDIGNPVGMDGNISADPLIAGGHLLPGSPCINAGTDESSTPLDIDGEP
ncbi:MAG: hypothetical protein NZ520_00200, partial [bacterium]|nr:hypothetical protein [bacterium]